MTSLRCWILALTVSALAAGCLIRQVRTRQTIPAASYKVVDHAHGRDQVELVSDTTVMGIPMQAGTRIWFDNAGTMTSLTAAGPFTMYGIDYPAETTLSFDNPYSGERLTEIELGGDTVVGPNTFGEGDRLVFDTFVASKGPNSVILASARRVGGKRYPAGTGLHLTEGGAVQGTSSPESRARSEERYAQKKEVCTMSCGSNTQCVSECMMSGS